MQNCFDEKNSGRGSSVWLEQSAHTRHVGGSNPLPATILTTLLCMILVMLPASVLAREVVRPENVAKFERFEERELRLIQQMVDEGKQRWRSNPDAFARFFLNFYYPDMRPFERDRLNVKVFPKKGRAIVQLFYRGKIHTIHITKVYPTYPDSVWVVKKMIVE